MSGQNVPYQLRTNKFIERQLFLDVLDFVRVWNGSVKYSYVSMGGRFLEDFKHINDRFAIEQMVSLENDEATWQRQKFNVPFGFVDCLNESSADFITNFDHFVSKHDGRQFIVWLDFAAANDRNSQLQEYEAIVPKMRCGDVIKVTLNANYRTIRKRPDSRGISNDDYDLLVVNDFKEQLDGYLPEGGISASDLKHDTFAVFLAECVRIAAIRGTELSELLPVPLMSCSYSDGEHQMLTVTAILADDGLRQQIRDDELFSEWPFRSRNWREVHEIRVPDLSVKERTWIDQRLASKDNAFEIHESLEFLLDEAKGSSIELVKNYMLHYRRYPTFRRVQ